MLTKGGCLPINGIGLVSTYLVFWAGTALLFYAAMNYAKLLYLSVADLGKILAFQNSKISVFFSNFFLTICGRKHFTFETKIDSKKIIGCGSSNPTQLDWIQFINLQIIQFQFGTKSSAAKILSQY